MQHDQKTVCASLRASHESVNIRDYFLDLLHLGHDGLDGIRLLFRGVKGELAIFSYKTVRECPRWVRKKIVI